MASRALQVAERRAGSGRGGLGDESGIFFNLGALPPTGTGTGGQGSNPRPDKRSRGGERHLDIFWRSQLQERISTDLTVALGGESAKMFFLSLSPPRPPRPDPARRSPTLERSAGHGQCAPGPKSAPSCRSASLERIGNFTYRRSWTQECTVINSCVALPA